MKVLVMGATGTLGKPAVEHFDQAGYQLRLFSRKIEKSQFPDHMEIAKGDVFNDTDLENAVKGCDAIHISLYIELEHALATERIVSVAKKYDIKLISLISGSTVEEKNSWSPMIALHLQAEKALKESGIPYIIYRPSWFFETLKRLMRRNRMIMVGKQPNPFHWLSAIDFARMIVTSYQKKEAWNKIFYILGSEKLLMKDVFLKYAKKINSSVKVCTYPLGLVRFIGFITASKFLKMAADIWGFYEVTGEPEDSTEANNILGAPTITFEKWLENI